MELIRSRGVLKEVKEPSNFYFIYLLQCVENFHLGKARGRSSSTSTLQSGGFNVFRKYNRVA